MEQTDIKYGGYSAQPSDYRAPDGDLALAMNVVPEDGTLKPLLPPKKLMSLPEGYEVLAVHNTVAFRHYIIKETSNDSGSNGDKLSWMDAEADDTSKERVVFWTADSNEHVESVNTVGNTLVVISTVGLVYFLWKDGSYKYLGGHLPEVPISFGLNGNLRFYSLSGNDSDAKGSGFQVDFIGESYAIKNDNRATITSQIMSKVNKFLADQSVNAGKFALPFLVRYALRLYDGSLTMHSAPILMIPSQEGMHVLQGSGVDLAMMSCNLDYEVIGTRAGLKNWSDIIKSVDIFISKPLYPWNQNGQFDFSLDTLQNTSDYYFGRIAPIGYSQSVREDYIYIGNVTGVGLEGVPLRINGETVASSEEAKQFEGIYCEWPVSELLALYSNHNSYVGLKLPEPEKPLKEQVYETSQFYLLASIDVDKLSFGERKNVEVAKDYLQSLVTREVMTDDYLSHDVLKAKKSFGYNSRINLIGVERTIYDGFGLDTMLCYINGYYNSLRFLSRDYNFGKIDAKYSQYYLQYYTTIEENNQVCTVKATNGLAVYELSRRFKSQIAATIWRDSYLFYPNINASYIVIYTVEVINKETYWVPHKIKLKPHEYLNGSYGDGTIEKEENNEALFNPNYIPKVPEGAQKKSEGEPNLTSDTHTITTPNKIYTSEVNNPFYFPVSGINTVGSGEIQGIATATKALSQGQFGQFPLYAFSTDGVWALEVSDTGTYKAKQPVTRDVCVNADSITQIDTAVLFATERGIMMLQGSDTVCISDTLETKDVFDADTLPHSDKVLTAAGLESKDVKMVEFNEYIKGCKMLYDYINQRILVYNTDHRYVYVYSLKSKSWGMQRVTLTSSINDYPNALAMGEDNNLVDVSHTEEGVSGVKGMVVTRPFTLGLPDVLKTVNEVLQRGQVRFGDNRVQQVLYGSRDLYNWHALGSAGWKLRNLHGTPYKYFRLALVLDLKEDESLWGCSVGFTPKLTNKMR